MTWEDFNKLTVSLVYDIKQSTDPTYYDLIIGLTRGGLPFAVQLSNYLNIPMDTLDYSSKNGNGTTNDKSHLPNVSHITGKRILLVDDLADSGNTLVEITNSLEINGNNKVETATLLTKKCSKLEPTFTATGTRSPTDEWIVFPWEPLV